MKSFVQNFLFVLLLGAVTPVYAIDLSGLASNEDEHLKRELAFQPSVEILDEQLVLRYQIADDYYLYRQQFQFKVADGRIGFPDC
ncbi:MAG: hypothetical protein D6694_14965, partial [Gammaproteobacteria bacterium]